MTRSPTRARRRSLSPLARGATVGAAALGLWLGSACGEGSAPPAIEADAGPACELGTRNCACIGGSRCDSDLLCIAGVCSARSAPPPPEMQPRPRPRPPRPGLDDPDPDAGSAPAPDGGSPDASIPGEAPEPDAG